MKPPLSRKLALWYTLTCASDKLHPSFCQSFCPSVRPSVCPSIRLSVHLSNLCHAISQSHCSDQLLVITTCVSYGSPHLKRLWSRSVDFLISVVFFGLSGSVDINGLQKGYEISGFMAQGPAILHIVCWIRTENGEFLDLEID